MVERGNCFPSDGDCTHRTITGTSAPEHLSLRSQSLQHEAAHTLEKLLWFEGAPVELVQFAAKQKVLVNVRGLQVVAHVFAEVEQRDPAVSIRRFLVPLVVVLLVAGMEVQDVLADEHEARNAVAQERFHEVALQEHDVVVQQVVPLADQFDDRIAFVVVGEEDLEVERAGTEGIPLRVDHMVVHCMVELELAMLPAEERRPRILFRRVAVAPVPEGFEGVHSWEGSSKIKVRSSKC